MFQSDSSLHCHIMDTGPVHCAVLPFSYQLLLVLIVMTHRAGFDLGGLLCNRMVSANYHCVSDRPTDHATPSV